MTSLPPALVLVTGPPGAGKTTLAPRLADHLGAVCISRDAIHHMVFDAWETADFSRTGKLNWDIFLWVLAQVAPRAPVVGETPLNHAINRTRLLALRDELPVPMIEVFLSGDPATLMQRVLRRAEMPGAHPIKVHFTIDSARSLLAAPYPPLLDDEHVVRVDTTDLDAVDVSVIAADVGARAGSHR